MKTEKYVVLTHLMKNRVGIAIHNEKGLPYVYDTIKKAEADIEYFGNDLEDFVGKVTIVDNSYHIYDLRNNRYYFSINSGTKETLYRKTISLIKTLGAKFTNFLKTRKMKKHIYIPISIILAALLYTAIVFIGIAVAI